MNTICEKLGKFQILSGTSLKIIAILAMAVEHFSKIVLAFITTEVLQNALVTWEEIEKIDYFIRFTLYKVGQIAYPIFFFLVAEGYRYTRDKKKYMARMLIFALITELPFDLGFFNLLSSRAGTFPFYWQYQNVLFTYFLAIAALYGMEQIKERFAGADGRERILPVFFSALCLLAAACLAKLIQCDYGAYGVILIAVFYWLGNRRIFQACAVLLGYILSEGAEPSVFLVISALLILLYNGKRGKDINKYFFYWFYPGHILLFYLITLALGAFL